MADQQGTIELRGSDDGKTYGAVRRQADGSLTASGAGVGLLRTAVRFAEAPAATWERLQGWCNGPLRAVVVK